VQCKQYSEVKVFTASAVSTACYAERYSKSVIHGTVNMTHATIMRFSMDDSTMTSSLMVTFNAKFQMKHKKPKRRMRGVEKYAIFI